MTPTEFITAIAKRTGAERVTISVFDGLPNGVAEIATLKGETWAVCHVDNSDWADMDTLLAEVVALAQRTFETAFK